MQHEEEVLGVKWGAGKGTVQLQCLTHLQGWVEVQIQSLSLSRGGREKDERHSTGHSSWESEEDLDQHKEDE